MGWILITMTYLSGAAYGPSVAMASFETQQLCTWGAESVIQMNADMMKTNIAGGRTQRDVVFARCVPSTISEAKVGKELKTLKN
jgi:hypothetical protein